MNTMPPPKRTEYALWHMNVTDCGSALPQGTRVTPCLGADCGNVSHAVSADGTHLGHNLPDGSGNRYCINLVSVAGLPLGKDEV